MFSVVLVIINNRTFCFVVWHLPTVLKPKYSGILAKLFCTVVLFIVITQSAQGASL